jgi:predicted nucleotidyltransferase
MLDPGRVDLAALADALDDRSPDTRWYLDPDGGAVAAYGPGEAGPPDTWVEIDPVTSRESYRDMSDFTAGVQHRRAAALLDRAIDGRGAFRRFKNTLFEFPEVRDQWYRFRDARSRRRAVDWLAGAGLLTGPDADLLRARCPDPDPSNDDVPAAVAADLAALYGPRLRQVLLFGSWASGEGSVESAIDLLVVLDDERAAILAWEELRAMDDVLWQHTERTGLTISVLPVGQHELARPGDPTVIRARAEAVRVR